MSKVQKPSNEELRKERDLNYFNLFTSTLGEKVLEDLKKSLHYGETVYAEKATNQDLAFHLGRQSVINDIVHLLSKFK